MCGFERRDEDKTGRCYPIDGGSPSLTPTPINIAIIVKESSIWFSQSIFKTFP
jgi:hypothetical protein